MWEQHLAHGGTTASAAAQQAATLILSSTGTSLASPSFVASPSALAQALRRNQTVLVAVYNPPPHTVSQAVSLPVLTPCLSVRLHHQEDGAPTNAGASAAYKPSPLPADVLRVQWPADVWPKALLGFGHRV